MLKNALLFFLVNLVCGSCSNNLLKYKNRRFYKESSAIAQASPLKLRQTICYDHPGMIDEGFCYVVEFIFKDSIFEPQVLNLQTDTAKISCQYDFYSTWNWEEEKFEVRGIIEMLDWKNGAIKIKENFKIHDFRRREHLVFKGTRKFMLIKN